MATPPRWMPLSQAIRLHPEIPEALLRKLVKDRVLGSKEPPGVSEALVDREDLIEAARRLDRRQWEHLRGQPISIKDAAQQYGLREGSLSRWADRGQITIVSEDKRWVFLDEADVAFTAALSEMAGIPGRALFP